MEKIQQWQQSPSHAICHLHQLKLQLTTAGFQLRLPETHSKLMHDRLSLLNYIINIIETTSSVWLLGLS